MGTDAHVCLLLFSSLIALTAEGRSEKFTHTGRTHCTIIELLDVNIGKNFEINWTFTFAIALSISVKIYLLFALVNISDSCPTHSQTR